MLLCYVRIRGMPHLVEDEGDKERRGRAIVLQNTIVDAHKDGVEDNTPLQEDGSHHLVCLQVRHRYKGLLYTVTPGK